MNAPQLASNSLAQAQWQARVDLAAAHRLAVIYGYHEAIDNHFTLLLPGHEDRFLLAPHGLHWSEVRASDLMVVGLDGTRHEGTGLVEDTAFFIHAPVHAAPTRPRCVLHTHMPHATALSMLEDPLLVMASQNAIGFRGQMAVCDYNGFALGREEGERMVAALGGRSVLILRNHGVLVTGASVAEAFNALYFFERAAEVQLLAQASGQQLRMVDEEVIDHTFAQYKESEAVGDALRIELHFAALKRMLDRRGEDYAS